MKFTEALQGLGFSGDSAGKEPTAMQEIKIQSLGWEDPLEKGLATHSNILVWKIPWTSQSMGSQRVGHDWATFTFTYRDYCLKEVHYNYLHICDEDIKIKEISNYFSKVKQLDGSGQKWNQVVRWEGYFMSYLTIQIYFVC